MATEFKVLGSLEVWHHGNRVSVPAGRAKVLLATLLLRANEVVSADTLVDRVWDGAPANPARARATLHMVVTRLRQALGPANVVRTTSGGYRAVVPEGTLDLHRFRVLVSTGRFAEALDLWRGEPLADVRSDALQVEVEALEEERLAALERRVDADLERGGSAELVPELRTLTARYPLRERFWGQLMLALYRSGRQADALATYRTVAKLLDDELGVVPGRELHDIHQAVLSGEPVAVSGSAAWPTPRQLPPTTADFVGREDLHREAEQALVTATPASAVPIAVVTGPPGSGKSALTVRIAHRLSDRFPDGQLFVNLGDGTPEPRDPGEVLAELLTAVGVPITSIPEDVRARSAAFRSRVVDRAVLLVLDGAVDAEQVRHLLPGSASCAVLISSRHLMTGLEGARLMRLRPLDDDEGLGLLSRMIGNDRVTREPGAARRIVAATGGLPLALRIVGARLATRPSLPLDVLATRLSDEHRRLDELSTAHMEVRASFDLSYAALADEVAVAFRRLGLLGTLDFAPWVVSVLTGADGDRLVERLLEANLLEELGVDATGEPRYRLHDLLAVYAAELVVDDGVEDNRVHLRRFVDALLQLADAANSQVPGYHDMPPLTEIDVDVSEQFRACAEGLAAVDDRAWLAGHLAAWSYYQSIYDGKPAMELAERAVTIAREAGDQQVYYSALREHASMIAWDGRLEDAMPLFEEVLAHGRNVGAPVAEAAVHFRISSYALRHGDLDRAATASRRMLDLMERSDDLRGKAHVISHASRVASALGNHTEAIALAERAYLIFQELSEGLGSANAAANLGESYLAAGPAVDAVRFLTEAIPAHEGVGATEALERMEESLRRAKAVRDQSRP
ncbi:BTAD domain-containing putative transcriptional regulator [Saccharothrix sp.]|uniref:AfsR/SARP family transcriptional regulator n=1 Tax=Saccharothrix sp. TaxID=1873460 RepID=UPI0028111F26|nr:BTAD domain-containing putative transcriptional regulator [Saccharothrix sp.]